MGEGQVRPALLLDVDGPLNPYDASNSKCPKAFWKDKLATSWVFSPGERGKVRLNRGHGPLLWEYARDHDVELYWATLWGTWAANRFIGPGIHLPEDLPGIDFQFDMRHQLVDADGRWKFGYVLDQLGDRPLAWLDDEFTMEHAGRDWFLSERAKLGASTLLLEISPQVGMSEDDLKVVTTWLEGGNPETDAAALTERRYRDG